MRPCFKSYLHQGDLCGHPQHFSQPSDFLHKEPILRPNRYARFMHSERPAGGKRAARDHTQNCFDLYSC